MDTNSMKQLRRYCALRRLDLGFNRIGAEGIEALTNVINSCSLASLNLGFNQLGDGATAELFAALAQNQTLLALGLRGCGLGEQDHIAFAEMLKSNGELYC